MIRPILKKNPPARPRWTPRRLAGASLLALCSVACFASAAWNLRGLLEGRVAGRPFDGPRPRDDGPLDLDGLTVPRVEVLDGGPGVDGIPSLTDPEVVKVAVADFLPPDARVVGATVGGESRAYPISVLNWHEVINDTLGGVPIAVVFCPLCDSASVVERTLDGEALEFGVSGKLYNSNVLLYDRTDRALWSQVGFEAVSGPHAGRALRHLDGWGILPFGRWRAEEPDSTVVTFDTGFGRNYDGNPYAGFLESPDPHRSFARFIEADDRLPSKARVLGVRVGDEARAYPLSTLAEAPGGAIRDRLGGGLVALSADPGTGAARVDDVPEGGQVVHTFWYAWAGFHPGTDIFGLGDRPDE